MVVSEIKQKNSKGYGLNTIKTNIPQMGCAKRGELVKLKGALLSPIYWVAAHWYGVPGLNIHRWAFNKGMNLLLKQKLGLGFAYNLMFSPMDSVRYFEFDFLWRTLKKNRVEGNFLDISSPRLIIAMLMSKHLHLRMEIVNPDRNDLYKTRELMAACDLFDRCRFNDSVIADLDYQAETFDIITSISVVEHIPGNMDREAINKMWRLLRPGGRLIISLPCAREAFEEYIDFNEYGLLKPDKDNFVFGQRFYDEVLLEDRIFSITGKPISKAIYGEKKLGSFIENRQDKISRPDYPFWREPLMMGKDYRYYNSIDELPGWGVIAMEFFK